jgi:predicted aspartyl protease
MGLLTIQSFALRLVPNPANPQEQQVQHSPAIASKQIIQSGILLQVALGLDSATSSYLNGVGTPVPNPVMSTALVDTGASSLCIDSSIAQALGLKRRGLTNSLTANGPRQCNVYAVSLSFPGSTLTNYNLIQACEVNLSNQPFKVLIGRDVMSRWHIHYNGQVGVISIAD